MYSHRLLLLLLPAAYLLAPLIINWWQQLDGPWFRPFLVWLGVVIAAIIIEKRRRHHA